MILVHNDLLAGQPLPAGIEIKEGPIENIRAYSVLDSSSMSIVEFDPVIQIDKHGVYFIHAPGRNVEYRLDRQNCWYFSGFYLRFRSTIIYGVEDTKFYSTRDKALEHCSDPERIKEYPIDPTGEA